jgi:hypothetical protein
VAKKRKKINQVQRLLLLQPKQVVHDAQKWFEATQIVEHYECLPLAIHAIGHRLNATGKPIEKYHVIAARPRFRRPTGTWWPRNERRLIKCSACFCCNRPLAIHAIGHRLNATGKPIEKYHVKSQVTDKKLAEPFLSIMVALEICSGVARVMPRSLNRSLQASSTCRREIIRQYGSYRLNATGKPIEKYHVKSQVTDKKLAEPFLSIMNDLVRHLRFDMILFNRFTRCVETVPNCMDCQRQTFVDHVKSQVTDKKLAEPFLSIMNDLFRLQQKQALHWIAKGRHS